MSVKKTLLSLILILVIGCENRDQQSVDGVVNESKPMTVTEIQAQGKSADGAQQQTAAIVTVQALVLEFQEVEQGSEPYPTRMLITDEYIRIDEAGEEEGYVLFDRKNGRIFSVLHESEQIMVVDPLKPLSDPPDNLQLHEQVIIDEKAPSVGSSQPIHYQFYANDTLCYHVIALDNFLPEATRALQDFQNILAAQQQETLDSTPKELQTPCYLANYIYAAGHYMSKGFPFEQWDIQGYRRSLINFEKGRQVDKSLFKLPQGYEFFSVGGVGGGTIM